jgi:hypothetical protein
MLKVQSESTSISEKSNRSLRDALCAAESPKAFDTTNWLNAPALEICRNCPVKDLCLETVSPVRTFFDGIAGGFLWLNGRALIKEYLALSASLRPYANYFGVKNYLNKIGVTDIESLPIDHKINRCSNCGNWCYDRPQCSTCIKGNGEI